MKTNLFIAFAVTVCCSACNNGTTTTTENHMDSTTVSATKTDSTKTDTSMANMDHGSKMNDAEFLTMANDVGMFEIEAAKTALKNSKDADVKAFANKMIADHTALGKDVKELAKKKNVTLMDKLSKDHQDKLDKLKGLMGKDFDKEYVETNVKGHKDCISHFEDAAKGDNDADVKALANSALPKLREHKDAAENVQKHVDMAGK